MKSRKQALKTMISLVGNAAAHRALYPASAFAIKEVVLYELQAEDLAKRGHGTKSKSKPSESNLNATQSMRSKLGRMTIVDASFKI